MLTDSLIAGLQHMSLQSMRGQGLIETFPFRSDCPNEDSNGSRTCYPRDRSGLHHRSIASLGLSRRIYGRRLVLFHHRIFRINVEMLLFQRSTLCTSHDLFPPFAICPQGPFPIVNPTVLLVAKVRPKLSGSHCVLYDVMEQNPGANI